MSIIGLASIYSFEVQPPVYDSNVLPSILPEGVSILTPTYVIATVGSARQFSMRKKPSKARTLETSF